MFHLQLNRIRWSLVFLILATVLVGCVREDPTSRASTNHAGAESETVSFPDVDASDHPSVTGQKPIYDDEADGAELIAAALERAQQEHKHVLIEWGGNWCGWCIKLHDVFAHNDQVHPIVHEEYELVLIDEGSNRKLMESYGGADRHYSFPHLTILDADGNVLVNQNTEPLELGSKHDPAKVAEFLGNWAPQPPDAETLLATALQRAVEEKKRVLVHVGTPTCGWCHVLSQFLRDHESQLARDYIDLKIDTVRMTDGARVAERFQPEGSLGVPWMVILDSSGKVLATSVGPEGNCGYPYQPEEIDHFIGMLTATRQQLTDEDLAAVRTDLEAYRKEREAK